MGRTHVGEVYGDCPPKEGPVLEQGKSVRSAPHEEEGGAAFIPCLLCHWQVRGREPGLWWELGFKRREGQEKFIKNLGFVFLLSYSDLIVVKLKFPQVESFFSWQWLPNDLSLPLSKPMSLPFHISSPAQMRRAMTEQLWQALLIQLGSICHTQLYNPCIPLESILLQNKMYHSIWLVLFHLITLIFFPSFMLKAF